jgi:hypothetical protein
MTAEAAHRIPVETRIDRLLAQQNSTPPDVAGISLDKHYDGDGLPFLQTPGEKRPIRVFFFDDWCRTDKRAG